MAQRLGGGVGCGPACAATAGIRRCAGWPWMHRTWLYDQCRLTLVVPISDADVNAFFSGADAQDLRVYNVPHPENVHGSSQRRPENDRSPRTVPPALRALA